MRGQRILLALTSSLVLLTAQALPLWELEGTQNRVWLMGSIHFLRKSDYPLPTRMTDAYAAADVVIMELDLAEIDPFASADIMIRMGVAREGRTLEDALGSRAWREAQRKAESIDIDLQLMATFEPWFAALQVTQLRLMQLGFDPSQGIESQLMLRAAEDGKQTGGLETLQAQLSALDSLSEEVQAAFLLQTLDEATQIDNQLEPIIAAWRAGDTRTLETELLQSLAEHPALYDSLLVDRNRDWAAQIAELADDSQDYLIVVGALHLVGNDSVLQLLERRGLRARQIR